MIASMLIGLSLPITATYIMTVVMVAPALVKLGIPMHVAHLLAFYFAVLSEVSPPVGLSPCAAAAVTGGNPFGSMMQAWKYSLPGLSGALLLFDDQGRLQPPDRGGELARFSPGHGDERLFPVFRLPGHHRIHAQEIPHGRAGAADHRGLRHGDCPHRLVHSGAGAAYWPAS